MKAFHGTTVKLAIEIIRGSMSKNTGVWDVSAGDDYFYVYPADKLANEHSLDLDDECEAEEMIQRGISDAKWHGQTATVYGDLHETDFCVLEMEIPDHLLSDDLSGGMESIASVIDLADLQHVSFEWIHTGKINIFQKPGIVAGLLNNDLFTDAAIDDQILEMAQLIVNSEETMIHQSEMLMEMDLTVLSQDEFFETFEK